MKKLSLRVFSFVLALILCVSVISGTANKALAAEVPNVTIVPLVSQSIDVQSFEVNTTVDAQYIVYYGNVKSGNGNISAGKQVLSFNTSSDVMLEVFAPYTDDNGDTQYVIVYSASSNAYWVEVLCVAENGDVLKRENIKLSKYNEPEVVYNAPAVIDAGAFEYHAANPSILFKYGDTSKSITYTKVEKGAKTVTVNYVDDQDVVLYTETMVLNYGDTAVISAPASYAANGNNYLLKTAGSYDVTYENAQNVYTFEYAKQAPVVQTPYNITIKLVDENGNLLNTLTKSVDVGKQVTVNLPATYEVGLKKYELADGEAASIVRDYASTEDKTYTVTYKLVGEAAAHTVTINFVDQATGTVLDTVTGTVEPDGIPFTYDISTRNSIEKDGVTYWVVAGQGNSKGKIVHAYADGTKAYNLFYSAKRDSIPESYDVTMRYICVNNNVVLATETKTVMVNSSVTFDQAPQTLTVDDKEYILLNGQDGVTVHKYNDAQTTYDIYYRDASIDLDNDDIIYVPGNNDGNNGNNGNGGNNAPDNNVNQGGANQPAEPDNTGDETPEEPDNGETEPTVVPDATEPTEVEEETTAPTEEVEIIEDDEVPLGNQPTGEGSNGSPSATPFVVGGAGLAAVIAVAFFFIKKRRTA